MPKRYSRRTVELTLAALTDTTTQWYLKHGTPEQIVSAAWREAPRHDPDTLVKWTDKLLAGILDRRWPPLTEWMMLKSLMVFEGARLKFSPNSRHFSRLYRRVREVAVGVGTLIDSPAHQAWQRFHSCLTPTNLS